MHDHDLAICDWYIFENDPGATGLGVGDGLPPGALDELLEAKEIGSALLKANVGARDSALRRQFTTPTGATMQRRHLRLAAKNVQRALQPVMSEAQDVLGTALREWIAGRTRYGDVRLATSNALRGFYEQARDIGRDAAGLDRLGVNDRLMREEETWFRSAVREELGYWHTFLHEINQGAVPDQRIWERLDAYVRAIQFMFEASRVQALPDNVLLHWIGPKKDDPNICEGCVQMMEWSPFPKELIPAVPRDGSTPCLTNCRHKVVVRVVSNYNDIIRRKNQLAGLIESRNPRQAMVQRLKAIKENRIGRRRVVRAGGRASNPFKGEPLPEVPTYRGRVGQMRMEALAEARGMLAAWRGVPEAKEDKPDDQGRETCGIFLRIPKMLADQFPSLGEEDKSPPHVTMLYAGKLDEYGYNVLVLAAQAVCSRLQSFVVEMTDYGEFQNPAGKTIAHMIPRVVNGPELADIHEALYAAVVARGIRPAHIRTGAFKPHVTLGYIDPGKRYDGPRPAGTFRVDALEVWGSGVWFEGELGNTVVPLGSDGPPVGINEAASLHASPYVNFDAMPYAAMDLRDVARLLQRAAAQRDANTLVPLLDRLLGALEHTVTAIEGRPRGHQVAQMFRQAFVTLGAALSDLPESSQDQARRAWGLLERLRTA